MFLVYFNKQIADYLTAYLPNDFSQHDCMNEKCIILSPIVESARKRISNDMIVNRAICSEQISISDSKSEYIIKPLLKAFYAHPKQLPDYVLEKYCARNGITFNRATLNVKTLQADSKFIRTICDHIAGMTDQFAAREYNIINNMINGRLT